MVHYRFSRSFLISINRTLCENVDDKDITDNFSNLISFKYFLLVIILLQNVDRY